MKTVFIDGQAGTTGLGILDRLQTREDIRLIEIPQDQRKNPQAKAACLNAADLVILCLPDQAARESVALIHNSATKVIDASTAHRTSEGWVYGLPELNRHQREHIRLSSRVSVPGCYPTGFILNVRPLVDAGILPPDYPVTVHAVSGFSGGGKKLIEAYQTQSADETTMLAYRPYALGLSHKHVPEMQKMTGLRHAPLFAPSVGNFLKGMLVSVPLFPRLLNRRVMAAEVRDSLADFYADEPFVQVMPWESASHLENGFLSPTACNGTNRVELFVFGHDRQILLVARLDNLGKGSSGAAVQNMNLMLGLPEDRGLA